MAYYQNSLRALMDSPDSFTQTPGYKARMDAAMQAVMRANSNMLGSGNAFAALQDAAEKNVNAAYGEEFDRRARMADTEGRDDIAREQIGAQERAHEGDLGLGYYRAGNDLNLGTRSADNADTRAEYDYSLGRERNAIASAESRNRYNIDAARQPLDWYRARTERGAARSTDWLRGDESAREWRKMNPPRTYF